MSRVRALIYSTTQEPKRTIIDEFNKKAMSDIIDSIGLTSRIMAAVRAIETQRPERLFEDPLAAQLAGDEMVASIAPRVKEYEDKGTPYVVVRTRFFDDFLRSEAVSLRQVVILGAGMDTRAFRLSWPTDTHLYELEQPEVLQTKESLLENTSAQCHRHPFFINLRQPWSDLLVAQGYQVEIPSVWLLEGLLYYLNETEVHDLLKIITNLSAAGSWLGADLINLKLMSESTDQLAKYWRFGCDEPETLLATYGWKASVVQPGEEGADFGRYTCKFPPRTVPDVARCFFVKAKKD